MVEMRQKEDVLLIVVNFNESVMQGRLEVIKEGPKHLVIVGIYHGSRKITNYKTLVILNDDFVQPY
ncbi:hypothetical protein DGG96_09490 [Legionella qingyii]|uniref:Uncharacterized protein n=1 Tax=Legionella qingyii TaxID=2184757 RepID=A0A317U555_9GAMM|nr:hypothetical protein DGG96_09490 [Legionella qingyii]